MASVFNSSSAFATRVFSRSTEEARRNVLRLYRAALKEVPNIIRNYSLELPVAQMRRVIRQDFLRQKDIRDPVIIDTLVFKGTGELEEAKLIWKTNSHIMRYFAPQPKKQSLLTDAATALTNGSR